MPRITRVPDRHFQPHTPAPTRGRVVSARPRRGAVAVIAVASLGAVACVSAGPRPGAVERSMATHAVTERGGRPTDTAVAGIGKSVGQLFAGRFAGVTVRSGRTGGLQIRIRGGANSFVAGEEPLYVVDGTPLPSGTGEIAFLTPADIARIEVLKNPADVGIYGVRGGNGVIRITTTRPGS